VKKHVVERSVAAVAVTFVATKVTKKAVSRNASLRSWPLPGKTGRTTAAKPYLYFVRSNPGFSKVC